MRARSFPSLRTPAAAGGVLAAVLTGTAVAGTGIGATFHLGVANSVNAVTALSGAATGTAASPSPMLRITNTATSGAVGASIRSSGGPALDLQVRIPPAPGTPPPPMRVNSGTKVANLNADKLDGFDSTQLPISGVKVRYRPVEPLDSAAGTITHGWVDCPARTFAIGGGANIRNPDQLLVATFPDVATRWSAYVKNDVATTPDPFDVYVICAAVGTYDGPTLGTGGSNLRGE
jgi:hypothetical protein